jgi:methionyl-tRNA synthetase
MSQASRHILVTSALPYANGPIHLGHLVEYIQTDIWVRFQKMQGHQCLYVCADDAHGTPIMLKARQEGINPEALIARVSKEHQADFTAFNIEFDQYHSTHSEENRYYATLIYERNRDAGHITTRTITQAYDPVENIFLPDRFIKGECPRCNAKDQYGDNCEACGASYSPGDLKHPRSAISGATPEYRDSVHLFFKLGDFETMLRDWTKSGALQAGIINKLEEWFAVGLQEWDISRDAPYFGFEIPEYPNKYFYVWLDAPIGYMASFRALCNRTPQLNFAEFWNQQAMAELYNFIGKDIMYFHTLFWPAMLHGAGFRTPTAVFCHGFLTVNGQKMSKSRGTFIKASTYLKYLPAEALRYYFASKLSSEVDDIDLNLEDFNAKINADLVGKLINIASRCAGFITKRFAGKLASTLTEPKLYAEMVSVVVEIQTYYETREYSKVVREVMTLADRANRYIDSAQPWTVAKQEGQEAKLQGICTMGLNLFKLLIGYLRPILPSIATNAEKFLNIQPVTFATLHEPLLNHTINQFQPLLTRIETSKIAAMMAESTI